MGHDPSHVRTHDTMQWPQTLKLRPNVYIYILLKKARSKYVVFCPGFGHVPTLFGKISGRVQYPNLLRFFDGSGSSTVERLKNAPRRRLFLGPIFPRTKSICGKKRMSIDRCISRFVFSDTTFVDTKFSAAVFEKMRPEKICPQGRSDSALRQALLVEFGFWRYYLWRFWWSREIYSGR